MRESSEKGKGIIFAFFFPVSIIYLEFIIQAFSSERMLFWGAIYIVLFSASTGLVLYTVSMLFNKKARYIFTIIVMSIITIAMGVQCVYYSIFKTYTVISSVLRAGDVLSDFWKQALDGIVNSIVPLILLFLPLILFIIFGKRITGAKKYNWKKILIIFLAAVILFFAAIVGIRFNTSGIMSYKYVYYDTFSPILSVPRFGVLTTIRLDIANMLFPDRSVSLYEHEHEEDDLYGEGDQVSNEDTVPEIDENDENSDEITEQPKIYNPNVMEIDFDDLIAAESDSNIADMHEYFSSVLPTWKNDYTGMFEGKNLIWIVAEGFSRYALSEEYTPTLSKLANEGFVFENFYNPVWGVSTSDGEYVTLTSLIPKAGVWSFSRSSDNDMAFSMGNILRDKGYLTMAYHNNTYTYYDRDQSHPNMGYTYKGVGNGLEVTKQWPQSDLEMMENSIGDYIDAGHFHTYYMTVSGHLNYTFMGNMMAYKHKSDVQGMLDAGYSEAASAYIACQMEFDQAVKYLIDQLEQAGKLEDTVLVISGDHYPYGLTLEQMEELAGESLDTTFEMYRSSLMIWNSGMETVKVDKYCSSLDILPTLLNLFGIEYDSRLLMGTDILSDSDPLVIFNDHSYITDKGRYDSGADTFTANDGEIIPDGYAIKILNKVNGKFTYSAKVLDYDYYAKVFKE